MKPCKIFFLLFLTIITHNSIFAVKWKWKYGWWNEKNLENTRDLLQNLQPLLENRSFIAAIRPRLSFAQSENLFENLNSKIEQFIMVSRQVLSAEKIDLLTSYLQQITNSLMSCKETIEKSSAMLLSTEDVLIEYEGEGGEKHLGTQNLLQFWAPYELIINELNQNYEKAISPTSRCSIS